MMLRKLHRTNALVLGVFIVAHLVNHLLIVGGIEVHVAVMEVLRKVYRPVVVEVALYGLFAVQIGLGLILMWRKGRPVNRWGWAQSISGGLLAVFLIQHMVAAMAVRLFDPQLDTNAYWAAAVVSRAPFVWYFAPYYALGIIALFVHIAVVVRKRARLKHYTNWVIVAGVLVAAIVVPSFMGVYSGPIELPAQYIQYIENYGAVFGFAP